MMQFNKSLSGELLQLSSRFFSPLDTQEGLNILNQGLVTLSFKKGNINTYLIVSAIIRDNTNVESKLVYKKRLEHTAAGAITSSCNCSKWCPKNHCRHIAALLLYALIENSISSSEKEKFELLCFSFVPVPPVHLPNEALHIHSRFF